MTEAVDHKALDDHVITAADPLTQGANVLTIRYEMTA